MYEGSGDDERRLYGLVAVLGLHILQEHGGVGFEVTVDSNVALPMSLVSTGRNGMVRALY